jgi:hypothetical protein
MYSSGLLKNMIARTCVCVCVCVLVCVRIGVGVGVCVWDIKIAMHL